MIKKSENLLTIHTHPDSFPPSIDDINSNYDHNYEIGIVICHDGRVYMYSAEERINVNYYKLTVATVYKGNIIKNLIMDCQSYTQYRPHETTGGIFVSWRRKEELPTGA